MLTRKAENLTSLLTKFLLDGEQDFLDATWNKRSAEIDAMLSGGKAGDDPFIPFYAEAARLSNVYGYGDLKIES